MLTRVLRKTFKAIIFIVFLIPLCVGAQSVSAVRAALDQARSLVVEGDQGGAVEILAGLHEGGFNAVQVITGDDVLATLKGNSAYDALVASMSKQAYPCEHDDRFREFDFWVGEWDVHIADGTFAGRNVIESEQRGCVLVEEWSSATGGTGSSINYLDKTSGEWVQVWNDASGSQIRIRGGLTEEGMLLTGTIHYVASGATADFRGLWTPLADGRVRQFFEQSNDGGETWSAWFEGFYTRASAP